MPLSFTQLNKIRKFHDEDDLVSDDAAGVASQQSIKAYVDTSAGLVVGPSSSVDNAITTFDGTTGRLLQEASSTMTDTSIALSSDVLTFTNTDVAATQETLINANKFGTRLFSSGPLWQDSSLMEVDLGDAALTSAYSRTGGTPNAQAASSHTIAFTIAGGSGGVTSEIDLELLGTIPSSSRYDVLLQITDPDFRAGWRINLIPNIIAFGIAGAKTTLRVPPMLLETGVNYRLVITRTSGAEDLSLDIQTSGTTVIGTSDSGSGHVAVRTQVTTSTASIGMQLSPIKRASYPVYLYDNLFDVYRSKLMGATDAETQIIQGSFPYDITKIHRIEIVAVSHNVTGNSNVYRFRMHYTTHRIPSTAALTTPLTSDVIDTTSALAYSGGTSNAIISFDLLSVATSGPATTNGKLDMVNPGSFFMLTADHSADINCIVRYAEMIILYT